MPIDVMIYTLGYILYLFSQWFISILIVRVTGLTDAGYFAMAMTVANIFFMFSSYGIRTYQISDIHNKFKKQIYISSRVVTSVLGFILCFGYSIMMGYDHVQIKYIMIYMIFKTCEALFDVFHGVWQQEEKLVFVGKSLIIKSLACMIVFIPYLFTKNLEMSLWIMSGVSILLLVGDIFFTKKTFHMEKLFEFNFKEIKNLLVTTVVMMLLILCSPILAAIPKLLVEKRFSLDVLGAYNSITTPTVLISSFASVVFQPLIPKFTRAYENGEKKKMQTYIIGSVGSMVVLGVIGYFMSLLLQDFIINLLYGSKVAEYSYLFAYVVISVILTSIVMCLNNMLIGIRKLKQVLVFFLMDCVICFICACFLIQENFLMGAVICLLVSQGIHILVECVYIKIILGALNNEECAVAE